MEYERSRNINEVTMNAEEWNIYLESGIVPQHFIQEMVELIKSGKSLTTTRHLAVYQSHAPIIETYLQKKNSKD
jgi:hypothetical protein